MQAIADEYYASAMRELSARELPVPTSLQELIDALNDHNETMIDAIRTVDENQLAFIEDLMSNDLSDDNEDTQDPAYDAWTAYVNELFELVGAKFQK